MALKNFSKFLIEGMLIFSPANKELKNARVLRAISKVGSVTFRCIHIVLNPHIPFIMLGQVPCYNLALAVVYLER